MPKRFYLIALLFFGIFCLPKPLLACHITPEENKEECEKTTSQEKTCERACCEKEDSKQTSEPTHDCDGSCQGNCHQVVTVFYFVLPISTVDVLSTADFFFRKDNFYSFKTETTSGFYFIWSPPNINS